MKINRSIIQASMVLCTLLFLTACKDEEKAKPQGAMPPPLVSIFEVEVKDYPYNLDFQAVTQGSKAVEVRARVQAIIKERMYEEGAFVKAGQILFQLERDEYEARMNQAKAQFDQARREWDRIRPLYAKNAVSQKERDNALANFESAKANLRIAEINLNYCQVVAPESGYSGKEAVTAGNLVSNGTLMTSVNQTNPIHVNFSIPGTTFLNNLQLMQDGRLTVPANNAYRAKIRLLDGSMYPVEGLVTFVDSQVEQTTGVVQARAEFVNKNDIVYPGQYVRIFLEGAVLKNALLVPQRAVLNTQMGSIVMLLNKDNVVEMRPVKVKMNVGQQYLLEDGLQAGDRIILDGLTKAKVGQSVTIAPPQGAGTTQGAPSTEQSNAKPGDSPKDAKQAEQKTDTKQ